MKEMGSDSQPNSPSLVSGGKWSRKVVRTYGNLFNPLGILGRFPQDKGKKGKWTQADREF